MLTTIRVWDETQGWMHEVQDDLGTTIARSRHLDQLQDAYPDAKPSGAVVCGDNIYPESR